MLILDIFYICCLILGIIVFSKYVAGHSLVEFLHLHPITWLFIGFVIIMLITLFLSVVSNIKSFLKSSDKSKNPPSEK